MQGKTHKKRAASAAFNTASSYHALRFRIASETEKPGSREFLRAREAAIWLGVPVRSLHQYVQQGLLPSYKLGRHRLFRKGELLSALGADRTASRSEILR
jgi:excisionase family DNA binding protein